MYTHVTEAADGDHLMHASKSKVALNSAENS